MSIIHEINRQIEELQQRKKVIQKACPHPEIAREYTFYQSTDEYGREDGPGHYSATCGLCESRFITDSKGGAPKS